MWTRLLVILGVIGGWAISGTLIAWWLLEAGFKLESALVLGSVAPPFVLFVLSALVKRGGP